MHSILIADHEPHVRYALSSKVLQAGFGLITAHDGRQALTLACARRPDLIVVEYRLPLLDGVDLSMRLRQTRKTSAIPIFMISLADDPPARERLLRTNIRALMIKPLAVRDLVSRITELLGPAQPIQLPPGIVAP